MRKILYEIFFDIRKNPFMFVLLVFQLTVCFWVCIMHEQLACFIQQQKDAATLDAQSGYYRIVDNLVGDYETAFFQNPDALGRLKLMYYKLTHHPDFEYIEVYKNPVVLAGRELPLELREEYENGRGELHGSLENGVYYNEVKCFWGGPHLDEQFHFAYASGSFWPIENHEDPIMPVVLGNDYANLYQVGDVIEGSSYFDSSPVQMRVYGILAEGANLNYHNHYYNLDRYVLLPFQNRTEAPKSPDDAFAQKALYLCKINGALHSTLSPNALNDIIGEICASCGISPASVVESATNQQSYMLRVSMLDILALFGKMAVLLTFFAVLSTLLYMLIKLEQDRSYYAILHLCHFSRKQLMGILFGNIFLPTVLSLLLALLVGNLSAVLLSISRVPVPSTLAVGLGIITVVYSISLVRFHHLSLLVCTQDQGLGK